MVVLPGSVRGLIAIVVAVACATACTSSHLGSSGGATFDAGPSYITPGEVPLHHYPAGTTCRMTRDPILPSSPDAGIYCGNGECCKSDADCANGQNGRCVEIRSYAACSYDQCFSSSDCAVGTTCACGDFHRESANVCVPSNCRIDSDCGVGGYCSPTFTAGQCGVLLDYEGAYCHTPNDSCLNDSDCASMQSGGGPALCKFVVDQGRWSCVLPPCAG